MPYFTATEQVPISKEIATLAQSAGWTTEISHSLSSWGCSSYVVCNKDGFKELKIRISDHPISSTYRVSTEVCYRDMEQIERLFYPERFVKVTRFEGFTGYELLTETDFFARPNHMDHEIIGYRVSKKGKTLVEVRCPKYSYHYERIN